MPIMYLRLSSYSKYQFFCIFPYVGRINLASKSQCLKILNNICQGCLLTCSIVASNGIIRLTEILLQDLGAVAKVHTGAHHDRNIRIFHLAARLSFTFLPLSQ